MFVLMCFLLVLFCGFRCCVCRVFCIVVCVYVFFFFFLKYVRVFMAHMQIRSHLGF
jgi:hypothetical protein